MIGVVHSEKDTIEHVFYRIVTILGGRWKRKVPGAIEPIPVSVVGLLDSFQTVGTVSSTQSLNTFESWTT